MADSKNSTKKVAPAKKVEPKKTSVKASPKQVTVPASKSTSKKPPLKPKGKATVAKSARANRKGDSIALFIDLDNTNASPTNIMEIFSILRNQGNVVYGKFFGYTDNKVNDFQEIVLENKLETAGKLRFKTDDASVIDTRLVIECIKTCERNRFDSVFIWAGVGELTPLFAVLQDMKLKTITVDLPSFDCKNKFVNEAIRLFSPHTMSGAYAPRNTSAVANTGQSAPSIAVLDIPVPVLPRVKGAPSFDDAKGQIQDEDAPMTQEEYRSMLMYAADEAIDEMRKERENKFVVDELATVNDDPPEEEENEGAAEAAALIMSQMSYQMEEDAVVKEIDESVADDPTAEFNDFGDLDTPEGKV